MNQQELARNVLAGYEEAERRRKAEIESFFRQGWNAGLDEAAALIEDGEHQHYVMADEIRARKKKGANPE